MPHQLGDLGQRGVAPDDDLVLGVAVGADQLVGPLGPGQVAHLGPRVHPLQELARQGVPEADGAVRCTAPRGQGTVLGKKDYGVSVVDPGIEDTSVLRHL